MFEQISLEHSAALTDHAGYVDLPNSQFDQCVGCTDIAFSWN